MSFMVSRTKAFWPFLSHSWNRSRSPPPAQDQTRRTPATAPAFAHLDMCASSPDDTAEGRQVPGGCLAPGQQRLQAHPGLVEANHREVDQGTAGGGDRQPIATHPTQACPAKVVLAEQLSESGLGAGGPARSSRGV